jgi:hypothetical protein
MFQASCQSAGEERGREWQTMHEIAASQAARLLAEAMDPFQAGVLHPLGGALYVAR